MYVVVVGLPLPAPGLARLSTAPRWTSGRGARGRRGHSLLQLDTPCRSAQGSGHGSEVRVQS